MNIFVLQFGVVVSIYFHTQCVDMDFFFQCTVYIRGQSLGMYTDDS